VKRLVLLFLSATLLQKNMQKLLKIVRKKWRKHFKREKSGGLRLQSNKENRTPSAVTSPLLSQHTLNSTSQMGTIRISASNSGDLGCAGALGND
jgi:hypothetical protein